MELGNKDEAIKYYLKSIEMNPGNQNGIDMLEKLGYATSSLTEEIEISEEILDSYVGEYQLAPGFSIVVSREGKQMKAQATGQPQFDIFPKSETEFYLKVTEASVQFNKNDEGKVDSMTLFQNGGEAKGMRVEK